MNILHKTKQNKEYSSGFILKKKKYSSKGLAYSHLLISFVCSFVLGELCIQYRTRKLLKIYLVLW